MEDKKVTQQLVTDANRRFYDAIALDYEKIDGRRSKKLESWLYLNLLNIRRRSSGDKLLDLGTGSGFVTRCCHNLFKLRVAIDISPKIIKLNRNSFDFGIAADINHLPFSTHSFNVVTCFSILHHLYSFKSIVSEAARVLKPGGIFYSDHDMDKKFSERFSILLSLYRKICNSKSRYIKINQEITSDLYNLVEWQEKGIDSQNLLNLFKKEGFSVEYYFHWFGLTPLTDTIFSKQRYRSGWGPLFSLVAVKDRK